MTPAEIEELEAWQQRQVKTFDKAWPVLLALSKGELPKPVGVEPLLWEEAQQFAWAIVVELEGRQAAFEYWAKQSA